MASFFVENFGCRATQADGAAIEGQFRDRGLERASSAESAALVILNTCTVTAAADQDARAAIRRIRRQNPGCEIIVTGCYAQRAPEEIAALPGVSRVIGNSHKDKLAEIALRTVGDAPAAQRQHSFAQHVDAGNTSEAIRVPPGTALKPDGDALVPLSSVRISSQFPVLSSQSEGEVSRSAPPANEQPQIFVSDIFAHTELLAAPVFDASGERTRPNLKVQDGCDNRCSFCVIPSVRGHSRSLQPSEIIAQVRALVGAGYREVVISGINLGRWGRDLVRGARRFEDLVRAILNQTTLEKLRLSSVEPMDWSDELIRLIFDSPRIARHAHVPLQSGSDRVLRLMHRKYRPWHYREKIEKIRAALPTAAIGADVMVGFPGETDADFEATRRLIDELPFTYLHVFTYSSRPGTPSATMPNQVAVRVARERNRILRDLAAEKKLAFMRSFVGKKVEAITLSAPLSSPVAHHSLSSPAEHGDSPVAFSEALTDNYLKLRLEGCHAPNHWITAQVEHVDDGMLVGIAQ